MNYQDATLYITHKHDLAREFKERDEAQSLVRILNVGRPETCNAFRLEICQEHGFHVRRGKNVYVKKAELVTQEVV